MSSEERCGDKVWSWKWMWDVEAIAVATFADVMTCKWVELKFVGRWVDALVLVEGDGGLGD